MDIETFNDRGRVIPFLFIFKTENSAYNFYFDENKDIISLFLNQIEKEGSLLETRFIEVYTHNINFDGFVLIEYFLLKNIPFKWFIRDLNLYYLDFSYKGSEIRIRCSYKILGLSVKALGDLIQEPKRPYPYNFVSRDTVNYIGATPSPQFFESEDDYLKFLKMWGNYINLKDVTIQYAFYDVAIVYKSLVEVFKISSFRLFENSFSFSSYSYKLFSKKYDLNKITKSILKLEERNYIENAYFGGRTEIFGNTKTGLVHRFDFPGMYGSCMKEKYSFGKPFFSTPNNFKNSGFYVATVISNLKIPIIPIRTKNKKIIYPNGRFTACLSRDEFLLFLKEGGIVEKIHSALTFPSEGDVFKDFVEKFDDIKLKGGFYKLYGKQVINSLYGSFALRKEKMKYVILYNEKELEFLEKESKVKTFLKFDKMIIAGVEIKESLNPRESRNIAYAAFISSKARIKLHKNVYEIDRHYTERFKDLYKLLYLETDSIDVSLPKSCLGESIMDVTWQKIYEGGVYISPKFYFLKGEERSKIKGIRSSSYSYEEIVSYFYANKEDLIFKSQLQFSKKNFILSQLYIDKTLKLAHYDKRVFSKDKLSTTALFIKE